MRNLTAIAIVFALAGCAAPDEFLLASPDAATADAPSTDRAADAQADVASDATGDADASVETSDAGSDVADVSTPDTSADADMVDASDASADVFADNGNDADAAQDAPATDAQADVTGDVPSDVADVSTGDAVYGDGGHDAGADTADVLGDVATDATDAPTDASESGDASDVLDASVDEVCATATTIAACTAIRFGETFGCGWCVGAETCLYGFELSPIRGTCRSWTWR